jgi:hypothetical protein
MHSKLIVREIDLLLAEVREQVETGQCFRILHRFREPGTWCAPGEEIVAVHLIYRGREFLVHLGSTLLVMFDYLAHHSRLPQTAIQIVLGIKADPFYRKHGFNASIHSRLPKKINRSEVRVYIERIRAALKTAFSEAGMLIDPCCVLVSEEETGSNRVAYRIKGNFDWVHLDHPRGSNAR